MPRTVTDQRPQRPCRKRRVHRRAALLVQHLLQTTGHLPVAVHRDEMDSVEGVRVSNLLDQLAGERKSGVRVGFKLTDDRLWNCELRNVGR